MQCIKSSATLRVGEKGNKPKPKIVFKHGHLYGEVKAFLEKKKEIWKILPKVKVETVKLVFLKEPIYIDNFKRINSGKRLNNRSSKPLYISYLSCSG